MDIAGDLRGSLIDGLVIGVAPERLPGSRLRRVNKPSDVHWPGLGVVRLAAPCDG
jgi:hypothetical protein